MSSWFIVAMVAALLRCESFRLSKSAASQLQQSQQAQRISRSSLSSYLLSASNEDIMRMYKESVAADAKSHLEHGQDQPEATSVFVDVIPAFPLLPPFVDHAPRSLNVEGSKNIVTTNSLKSDRCIVYAAGIASDSSFEQQMATTSACEVHAFDCTINASATSVAWKAFHYHNWCIGKGSGDLFEHNGFARAGGGDTSTYKFNTLESTMKELGHSHIDLLKFDIEGFEWQLFQDEILTSPKLPMQLSFELHTAGANDGAVPPVNVHGKHRKEVDDLFLQLYDKGYRVVSKEINPTDKACAEFVAINVDGLHEEP